MSTPAVPMDAKRYEMMAIINPDIGEDAIKKRLDKMRKQITSAKGEIFHEELWGLRDLAYNIKKHDRGYYAVFDFVLEPEQLKEIEATLRLEPEVLRHMVMVLPLTYQPKDYTLEEDEPEDKKGNQTAGGPLKEKAKTAPKEMSAPAVKDQAPAPKKAEVTEAKPVTKAAEEAPKKVAKKKEETKQTLEDVDAKLKKLIDNPDLNF